jgi:hypothetical protein
MPDTNFVNERECERKQDAILCKIKLLIGNVDTRLNGMDTALKLKSDEMDRRLVVLNELRSEVLKDREQFLRQEVYNAKIQNYDFSISNITRRITIIETRAVTWTAAIGVFFVLLQIALHFVRI